MHSILCTSLPLCRIEQESASDTGPSLIECSGRTRRQQHVFLYNPFVFIPLYAQNLQTSEVWMDEWMHGTARRVQLPKGFLQLVPLHHLKEPPQASWAARSEQVVSRGILHSFSSSYRQRPERLHHNNMGCEDEPAWQRCGSSLDLRFGFKVQDVGLRHLNQKGLKPQTRPVHLNQRIQL